MVERRWWRGGCGDTILAGAGETETCVERNFSKSFSPHMFPEETCAERNFSKSFSPRNGGREGHFAQVSDGNVCELAPRAPPRSHFWAILRRFRLVTCANWRTGHDIRGEKLFEKLLSAQVPGGNVCREKLLKKLPSAQVSASPSRAKKEPKWVAIMMAMGCHHDGHGLPS